MGKSLDTGIYELLEEAKREQLRLRDCVVTEDRLGPVRRVAGLDVHFSPSTNLAYAAAAQFQLPALELEESVLACTRLTFPYVPGFLSFREAPAMLEALSHLTKKPDLLLVDGQGLAHPHRFGLACHIGVSADIPTIGVAKSRLLGCYEDPAEQRGVDSPLSPWPGHRRSGPHASICQTALRLDWSSGVAANGD